MANEIMNDRSQSEKQLISSNCYMLLELANESLRKDINSKKGEISKSSLNLIELTIKFLKLVGTNITGID